MLCCMTLRTGTGKAVNRQVGTIVKNRYAKFFHTFGNADFCKACAPGKSAAADFRKAVGKMNFRKFRTIGKSIISDTGNPVWDMDFRKVFAGFKSQIAIAS